MQARAYTRLTMQNFQDNKMSEESGQPINPTRKVFAPDISDPFLFTSYSEDLLARVLEMKRGEEVVYEIFERNNFGDWIEDGKGIRRVTFSWFSCLKSF